MKKLICFMLCIVFVLSLCGCENSNQKADQYAKEFISALLKQDEAEMAKYLHPDYINTAMPNDEFYKNITENHFFTAGNSLDEIYALGKSQHAIGQNEEPGERFVYKYTILSNELFYDVDIIIYENENGYGISGFTFSLNTNPQLYISPNEA